jgi:hypothetical protein
VIACPSGSMGRAGNTVLVQTLRDAPCGEPGESEIVHPMYSSQLFRAWNKVTVRAFRISVPGIVATHTPRLGLPFISQRRIV